MWVIAVVTIVGATSANPEPQYSFGGGTYSSIEQCEGTLLKRQSNEKKITKNSRGEFVLYGQARGYVWTQGCVWIPN